MHTVSEKCDKKLNLNVNKIFLLDTQEMKIFYNRLFYVKISNGELTPNYGSTVMMHVQAK